MFMSCSETGAKNGGTKAKGKSAKDAKTRLQCGYCSKTYAKELSLNVGGCEFAAAHLHPRDT